MRWILLTCATGLLLTLPAGASAAADRDPAPGFLVVQNAAGDGGADGRPVVTVVVEGFAIGRISQEARVDVYQLPSATGEGAPQAVGPDVSSRMIRWHGFVGREYSGSGFRFRAMGGAYRVVVRGAGVYLFAGGNGSVKLRGSSFDPQADGKYAIDGGPWHSLPQRQLTRQIGGG